MGSIEADDGGQCACAYERGLPRETHMVGVDLESASEEDVASTWPIMAHHGDVQNGGAGISHWWVGSIEFRSKRPSFKGAHSRIQD